MPRNSHKGTLFEEEGRGGRTLAPAGGFVKPNPPKAPLLCEKLLGGRLVNDIWLAAGVRLLTIPVAVRLLDDRGERRHLLVPA
jgi:hypothetical protein